MLHALIAMETGSDPRREPRIDASSGIPLRQLGQCAVEARLVNISSHGFMAQTHALILPGSRLWVMLPGQGRVNALVIWTRSGCIGAEFAEPIDPLAVIDAIGRAGG